MFTLKAKVYYIFFSNMVFIWLICVRSCFKTGWHEERNVSCDVPLKLSVNRACYLATISSVVSLIFFYFALNISWAPQLWFSYYSIVPLLWRSARQHHHKCLWGLLLTISPLKQPAWLASIFPSQYRVSLMIGLGFHPVLFVISFALTYPWNFPSNLEMFVQFPKIKRDENFN